MGAQKEKTATEEVKEWLEKQKEEGNYKPEPPLAEPSGTQTIISLLNQARVVCAQEKMETLTNNKNCISERYELLSNLETAITSLCRQFATAEMRGVK